MNFGPFKKILWNETIDRFGDPDPWYSCIFLSACLSFTLSPFSYLFSRRTIEGTGALPAQNRVKGMGSKKLSAEDQNKSLDVVNKGVQGADQSLVCSQHRDWDNFACQGTGNRRLCTRRESESCEVQPTSSDCIGMNRSTGALCFHSSLSELGRYYIFPF